MLNVLNKYIKQGKTMPTTKQITPIVNPISVDDFKKSAKRLVEILKSKNIELKHSEALEMMSNIDGYKDYNTFVAMAKKNNEESNSQYANLYGTLDEVKKTIESSNHKMSLLNKGFLGNCSYNNLDQLIEDLEKVLYFYEDEHGNYLEVRRAAYDIVEFSESPRVEDFILITLRNEYMPIKMVKIGILSKDHYCLELDEILKKILIEFKNIKLKTKVKNKNIPIQITGKVSKNFLIKELTTSYTHKITNNETLYFGIKYYENEENFVTNNLIIRKGDETILDESIEYIEISNIDEKLKKFTLFILMYQLTI